MENLEEFVPINGYECIYEINRKGVIKRISRLVIKNVGSGFCKDKFMRERIGPDGYYYLRLCKNRKQNRQRIHRMIAITFIPNPQNKPCVNHINGIKTDNRVENLEWCTISENAIHSYKTGLNKQRQRSVTCTKTGKVWDSISDCAKDNNIKYYTLCSKVNGRRTNNTTYIYDNNK